MISNSSQFLDSIGRNSISTKQSYSAGLNHLNNFIKKDYPDYNLDTIIDGLVKGRVNVYTILDGFISYIQSVRKGITVNSIKAYLEALKSYFSYHDVDIDSNKYKRRVKLPKVGREDELPIDGKDIRNILISCSAKRRIRPYLMILASSGLRAVEGLSIRFKDIDFSSSPTKIHIRKEFTKTKVARDIYISDEANKELKGWIDYKNNWNNRYRLQIEKGIVKAREYKDTDLIFTVYDVAGSPHQIYAKVIKEFQQVLKKAGLDELKETGIGGRRKITLHSFRRFVKTVISTQTNTDYSEWFLGHSKSPYWTMKEHERREIYATKIMKHLTFLDFELIEATGKSNEAKLEMLEKENHNLTLEISSLKSKEYDREEYLRTITDISQSYLNENKELQERLTALEERDRLAAEPVNMELFNDLRERLKKLERKR